MPSSILPTISPDTIPTIVPRRYWKCAFYTFCTCGALMFLSLLYGVSWDDVRAAHNWSTFAQSPHGPPALDLASSPNYPPDYAEWHKIEEALPQHNRNLSFPEGKEGRYVYFSEHVKSASPLILISTLPSECWWLTILCCNSGGVGERTPGTFLPGLISVPRPEIVRDCLLDPISILGQRF
jgi:hypothetical protein